MDDIAAFKQWWRLTAMDDIAAFKQWWRNQHDLELGRTVDKMEAYGSGDLKVIGDALKQMGVADCVPSEELAILFYAVGKCARAVSAISEGRPPTDDTWFDLRAYAGMARAVRAGVWPGVSE